MLKVDLPRNHLVLKILHRCILTAVPSLCLHVLHDFLSIVSRDRTGGAHCAIGRVLVAAYGSPSSQQLATKKFVRTAANAPIYTRAKEGGYNRQSGACTCCARKNMIVLVTWFLENMIVLVTWFLMSSLPDHADSTKQAHAHVHSKIHPCIRTCIDSYICSHVNSHFHIFMHDNVRFLRINMKSNKQDNEICQHAQIHMHTINR